MQNLNSSQVQEKREPKNGAHSEPHALIFNLCRHILEPAQEQDLRALAGDQRSPILGLGELPEELREKLLSSPSDEYSLHKVASATWKHLRELWFSRGKPSRFVLHLPIGSPAFMWALQSKTYSLDPEFKEALVIAFSHSERLVEVREGKKVTSFRYSHLISFFPEA